MTDCDRCPKQATQKYHQLTRPGEHYFCDEHAESFRNWCLLNDVDWIRGNLE